MVGPIQTHEVLFFTFSNHHGYLLTLARNANDGIPDQNFEALNTSRSRFNRYA